MKKSILHILILLGAFGCTPAPPVIENYDIFLPAELKADFYFKPGSYWIYREPASGFSDSIWVVSAILDTVPILHKGSRDTLGLQESLKVTYRSIFFGSRFQHFTESDENCVWFGGKVCHWIKRGNLNNSGTVTTSSRIMGYPFELNTQHLTSDGGTGDFILRMDSFFSTYAVDTQIFNCVHMTRINVDPTQQNSDARRYFARNVGVIRRHLPLGNIDWRLVRYRAIQ